MSPPPQGRWQRLLESYSATVEREGLAHAAPMLELMRELSDDPYFRRFSVGVSRETLSFWLERERFFPFVSCTPLASGLVELRLCLGFDRFWEQEQHEWPELRPALLRLLEGLQGLGR